MRAVRPLVLTVAAALLATPLAPTAASAASAPTVTITSPTNASAVAGKVTVTVAGRVDPGDLATAQTTLVVNGTAVGVQGCGPAVGDVNCPTTFSWDTTELNGSYTLTAHLAAAAGADASPVLVTAANPLPQVAITSPAANAVVKGGTLTVHATGTVDLSQNDQPASLQLLVDGAKYGLPQACTVVVTTTQSCDADFTVAQPTWSGSHVVAVTMTTLRTTASSATVPYLFFTGTRTTLQPVAPVRAGKRAVIRGAVVGLNAGAGVAGARVVVTVTPAIGKKRTFVLRTGATGHFSLATTLTANSTVTATATGARDVGSSHASTKAKALAPITCKADLTVRHGSTGNGTCRVAHLPDGTRVSLQYQSKHTWHVLGTGPTRGTDILISYKFGAAGRYPVRIVLGASKVYAATNGTPFTVRVT